MFANAKDSYTPFSLAREIFLPRQQNVHFSMLLASFSHRELSTGGSTLLIFRLSVVRKNWLSCKYSQVTIFSAKMGVRKKKEERVKETKCRFISLFVWFMNEWTNERSTVRIRIDTFFSLHYDATLAWESCNSWPFCEKFRMERINDILFRSFFDTE